MLSGSKAKNIPLKSVLGSLFTGVHANVASIPLVTVDDVLQTDGACTL